MNIFNADFQDFITALNNNNVDYILLGGYAVILYGYSRNTGDMDIFVRKSEENYRKLQLAFREFGMPMFDMTLDNFLHNAKLDVFTFGMPPVSIDILTQPKELDFDETFENAEMKEVDGLNIRVIHLGDLIRQKKAVNRAKDLNDIEHLSGLDEEE